MKKKNFKINIKQSKILLDTQEQLFIDYDNNLLDNIINKYFKYQLSNEVFYYSKNITNRIFYKFLSYTDLTYFIYELKKYNLKNKNVLIISPNLHISESIEYINEHFKNNTIKYKTILLQKYTRITNEIFNNNLHKFKRMYNTNNSIDVFNNNINELNDFNKILPKCDKYDFMILDNLNTNNELYKQFYYSNKYLFYTNNIYLEPLILQIYNILNNLNKNGNCIIYLTIANNNELRQLLYYISTKFKYFKINKIIYNWVFDIFIDLQDFKGADDTDLTLINDIYNKFRKIYPENINKNSLQDLFKKSITNILEPDDINKYNEFVKELDNNMYGIINNINNIIKEAKYLEGEIKLNNTNLIKYYEQKKIADTIGIAKLIDIELLPRLEQKVFEDEFGKTILTNIYSYDNYIWYKFRKHPTSVKFNINVKKDKQIDIFDDYIQRFRISTKIIDTRNLKDYQSIKMKVRHYEKSLSKYIENNFTHNHKVSRAFLKSYEIIETLDLVNPKLNTINVFFICEAPGAFILALNHYIKTKTNIENYNWNAQTLHPKQKFQNERGFGDDFKLMRNFKERWDFGKTKTGDITDIKNIKYYRDTYKDNKLHLVAGDCGIAYIFDSDPEKLADKLHIAQIITMLSILKKGGNFVLKMYLPSIEPIYISLFYLIYTRFKSFEIYKSFQNSWSPEFYIIGKNYSEPISDNEFNKLISLLSNFNINNSIIPINKIPEEFILQLDDIINNLIQHFKMAIKRVIYYVDNYDDIKESDMKKLSMSIKNKNEDWSKIFKIKKINKKDLIQ